ncbi:efflux RND transporter periplasmic adaptor subunit [Anditalea andensis]|uniref:Uncharacterized protein n=1 Tax=Anditalea andensis TaxID=1048983 RepID=A0A074L2S5_9BACT|nr:efflux RND transporter periplasmic adaptor subunit [Anditalea andensis]KEO74138.1 hypothetical protein EL17_08335 [Anditalea andensis]
MLIFKRKSIYLNLAILVGLYGCGSPESTEQVSEDAGISVNTAWAINQELPQEITYSGSLEAWEIAFISGQTGTRIDRIHADEGDNVREGALLALMNATQFHQAQLQVDLSRRELDRLDTLVQIGSVSGQQFDQMQTELENAMRNLDNVLENTELRAPFSGVITRRYFSRGEIFSPGADRPAILTLMQINPIKLTVQVAEQYYRTVQEGMEAVVNVSVFPEKAFIGKIFRKIPQIDTGARTFQVEIQIENADQELKPGMFSRATIGMGESTGVFIPSLAVLSQPGTNERYIFTIDDQNIARRTNVTTGPRFQDLIKIEDGLEPGTAYVTEGMQKLVDGNTVRIISSQN